MNINYTETWYEIQSSAKGADDWFALGGTTFDTLESAERRIHDMRLYNADFRIVRKTLTEELVTKEPVR